MKSPINNDNLDQFFNKAKADEQNLDDFEKDALAGFDMLESEQEARNLKNALDERITKELFKEEEKKNPKIYWLAAAGLALVIGLSTLFILNNSNSVLKSNDLAITTTEKNNTTEVLPESQKVLSEEAAAPPTEQAVTKADEPTPKAITAEQKNEGGLKETEETKNVKDAKAPTKGVSQRMVVASAASNGPKDVPNFESGGKKESDKNLELSNSRSNNAPALDDLAKNKSTKDKENDDFKAPITTAKPAQEISPSQSEANDESNYKTEKSEEKKSGENFQTATNSIAANTSSSSYRERKQDHTKAKKQNADQQPGAGLAGSTNDNKPASTTGSSTKAVGDISTDKKDDKTFINCYYSGGEAEITKDIKQKLTAINLDQKFDVTLYINEKKVVNKVEFINAYDLNQKQKEEVTKILKSLTKFNFFMAPTSKSEYSYKVVYRP